MDPESLLVERLLDRSLLQPGEAGEVACAEVVRAYREALSNLTVTPRQFDSVRACLGSGVYCSHSAVPPRSQRPRRLATGG
jgi:hypothetical protein